MTNFAADLKQMMQDWNNATEEQRQEALAIAAARARRAEFPVGTKVTTSGYKGTVVRVCEWTNGMVEVRLASGTVCVDVCDVRHA